VAGSVSNRQSQSQALAGVLDRIGEDVRVVAARQVSIEQCIDELKHMSSALTESLYAVKEGIVELHQQAKETLEQVKRSEETLRKAVFEATEINTPTCFVILPHKLGARGETETDDENAEDMHEHLLGLDTMIAGVCCNDDEEDEGESAAVQLQSLPDTTAAGKKPEGRQKVSLSILAKAQRRAKSVDKWLSSTIYAPDKTVYLYLVDELTGSPVLSERACSVYPIEIKSPRESLQKLVPMMYLGIAAMSLGAGVARMFGIPAPKMPASEAFKAIGKISQANTVA